MTLIGKGIYKIMEKIVVVAGARPNFMKIAPLLREFEKYANRFDVKLVHTGQHYDYQMSDVFLRNFGIREPDMHLNAGSGSHAEVTARVMVEFEKVLKVDRPDLVIVVGDVNSTLACSLVASKMGVKVAHVEAGLRSFDREMPEEINRLVTDALSDYLFVSELSGLKNLKHEGVSKSKVFYVGNIMIDTLFAQMQKIDASGILESLQLMPRTFAVMTIHRPSNVDVPKTLAEIHEIIERIANDTKIVYPIHPRTKKAMEIGGYLKKFEDIKNLLMIEPLGYSDFLKLMKYARWVLTDSGGIQEETTVLHVPCLTMRENTERPSTITQGTNILVGRDSKKIHSEVQKILAGRVKKGRVPKYWDGKAAERIVKIIKNLST